ncbi:hypothetical protein Ataiwa_25380 [Algoriphagus taiwanensis]|uniref:Uncharacterized protein n=1 Tax=Algoriphagus taiwanensis TaxID=1445656 RepID=A0ABQ6Q2A4_9BACT|nr:hypothetical protein Ataiwa_25380 [Algoriphagus taiwanensis]
MYCSLNDFFPGTDEVKRLLFVIAPNDLQPKFYTRNFGYLLDAFLFEGPYCSNTVRIANIGVNQIFQFLICPVDFFSIDSYQDFVFALGKINKGSLIWKSKNTNPIDIPKFRLKRGLGFYF